MTLQVSSCLHDSKTSIQKTARLTDQRGLPHISAALCFGSNNLTASTCISMLSLILCSWRCKRGSSSTGTKGRGKKRRTKKEGRRRMEREREREMTPVFINAGGCCCSLSCCCCSVSCCRHQRGRCS